MKKSIKDLVNIILKKKLYIILITMILVITGVCYTFTNVKCVVSQKILVGESDKLDTYIELIKGSAVLEEAIQNLGVTITSKELGQLLEVQKIENTNVLELKVFGEENVTIQSYADEIVKVFMKQVNEIYENQELYVVDNTADYFHEGNAIVVGIRLAFVGFTLSSLFFVGCFLLDNKIKSCKELEEITGLKSLISIPNMKAIAKKKLNIRNIRAHRSEVFKNLMTNIQFVNNQNLQSKTIVITSPKAAEGKTYVANNLAIEFAKAGRKVIIIDGDMRRGRLAKVFELPNDLGFSNYLSNLDSNGNVIHERITRFIHDTEIKNLNVITSGNIPPNPAELLKQEKINELIKDLKVFYDMIIFDTVPILEAPEATILSKACDLTLVISSYGNTKMEEFSSAYKQIEQIEGSNIGIGFNKIPDRKVKKKLAFWRTNLKQQMHKMAGKVKVFFQKLKNVSKIFYIIKNIFKVIAGLLVIIFLKGRNLLIRSINGIKVKSENVKEYIRNYKAKREKIKLIEAGSLIIEEEEEGNIIKEVFETKMAKLETDDEIEYKKKLDVLKNNMNEKTTLQEDVLLEKETPEPMKIITNQVKSKFDLIREQQEKTETETIVKEHVQEEMASSKNDEEVEPEKIETQQIKKESERSSPKLEQEEIALKHQQLKEKQRIEREKKEEEKRAKQEYIDNFQDIDFHNPENLTEEMIRKQVEMDEMIRLAEKEEEEEKLKVKKMKQKEKSEKRKARKENWKKMQEVKTEQWQKVMNWFENIKTEYIDKNIEKQANFEEERNQKQEAKIEEKIRKESEKNENRVRIAKVKEEKRAYREMEKQKHKEELRMNEELQQDNLYPKPRM